jgi:hypothetical protein
MRLAVAALLLLTAQDEPKPPPKPLAPPKPGQIQPGSPAVGNFDGLLQAKDRILLKFEEPLFQVSGRGPDKEGNTWVYQLRMPFVRAKPQSDESSAVRGLRMSGSVTPVPFVKGSTLESRHRTDTLGPDEVDPLIRLRDQMEKAIAQKESGFESASFPSSLGLRFYATYTTAEPLVGIYEENPELVQPAKTLLKDLLDAVRKGKEKIVE